MLPKTTNTPNPHPLDTAHRNSPASAAPVPVPGAVWEGMDPLLLTDRMRARLRGAVEELLAVPGLVGAPESVRMAAVVLMAKTNAADLTALVTAGELGRWLGISDSTVRHTVRPWLQRGVVCSVDETLPDSGWATGIRWEVQRLVEARQHGAMGDTLRLTRPELTALLRVCEELFAPGWGDRPGGLLAGRTGHGAAGDRLVALRAVLHGRPDGTVPMCSGAVDRRGRAAATIGRMRDQDSGAGARCLTQLEAYGVIARLPGARERLVVPAVARAYRRMRRAAREAGRVPAQRPSRPAGAVEEQGGTAVRDQNPLSMEESQVKAAVEAGHGDGACAGPHAPHSSVVQKDDVRCVEKGFSGGADHGESDLPERAGVREDQAALRGTATASSSDGSADALQLPVQDHDPVTQPVPSAGDRGYFGGGLRAPVPQTSAVLAQVVPEPSGWQRERLRRLVDGLLADGDDDAVIASRLWQRLQPLATGNRPGQRRFRRDGFSWAVSIGLPYTPGGMVSMPCRIAGCRDLVRTHAWRQVRCDACELHATETVRARRALTSVITAPARSAAPAAEPQCAPVADGPLANAPSDATSCSPGSAGGEGLVAHVPAGAGAAMGGGLPPTVREQLAVIRAADPSAARAAEQAAAVLYRAPDGAPAGGQPVRDRVTAASSSYFRIVNRYAEVLTRHYAAASTPGDVA